MILYSVVRCRCMLLRSSFPVTDLVEVRQSASVYTEPNYHLGWKYDKKVHLEKQLSLDKLLMYAVLTFLYI